MALKKQSIRSNQLVTVEGEIISKDKLISRKMLKQGGSFKVAGIKYKVELKERSDLDSNGDKPVTVPPLPGERTF